MTTRARSQDVSLVHPTDAKHETHSLSDTKVFFCSLLLTILAAWLSGSVLVSINKVTIIWALLVLGWVTVCGRANRLCL